MGAVEKPSTDDIGKSFERYLAHRLGFTLIGERRWQIHIADTACRTEIKFDRLLHKTGNLYFEGAGCRRPGGKLVRESVFKPGCKFYAIGDCSRILIFKATILKALLTSRKQRRPDSLKRTPTSCGLTMKYEMAKWYAKSSHEWDEQPLACEINLTI